jgi:hypothetical protein
MRDIKCVTVALLLTLVATACGMHRPPGGGDGDGGVACPASCPVGTVCSNGACKTPCDAALDHPSNVGCDFWGADLDNEAFSFLGGISNNAAAQQYSIVAANDNADAVTVTVTKNAARVGEMPNEQVVATVSVPPQTATRIDLPQREVDGAMGQNGSYVMNSGSGTFVSPHAYHIVASEPIVVYQFNPIVQAYSNDASTLIPIQALGNVYSVIGWNTANPCGLAGMHIDSIPDHSFVAIIPTQDDTTVTVTTTHAIAAAGGDTGLPIAQIAKGGTVTLHLSRYTVANLESYQPDNASFTDCTAAGDGDFTGTQIRSDKPIAVFTGGERGIGFGGADNVVYPPDWDPMTDSICCTDHLEEQLLPVTALGKAFAVARSPIRSTDATGWKEPDLVRVLATVGGTHVATNLPAPYDAFTLAAGQQKTFAATTGFAMTSDQPIEVATYLVSQQFVKHGWTGDPSQLLVPASEQFRKDYVFLVPPSWQANFAVFAKPTAAMVTFDGMALAMIANCYTAPIGDVAGIAYEQVTCPAAEGHHVAAGDQPFGIAVYGWHDVGSYAFVGGSDVKIINPIF